MESTNDLKRCVKQYRDIDNELRQLNKQVYERRESRRMVEIEMMDLVFSIDNVFAAVAFTPNLWLICGGVFIGILAMRFATTKFVKVLEKNPILERVAYWVIGALGLKLVSSYWLHDLNTEAIDAVFSILTLLAFIIPIIIKKK